MKFVSFVAPAIVAANLATAANAEEIRNPTAREQVNYNFQEVFNRIGDNCIGSFADFDTLTSRSCVTATTRGMQDVAFGYAIDVGIFHLSTEFTQRCTNLSNLNVEVKRQQDPHGPWYDELEDVTKCLNAIKTLDRSQGDNIRNDVLLGIGLINSIIYSYEKEYLAEYPNEGWTYKRPEPMGAKLDALFGRPHPI